MASRALRPADYATYAVLGVFSDWPAAVTYYANCTGLK